MIAKNKNAPQNTVEQNGHIAQQLNYASLKAGQRRLSNTLAKITGESFIIVRAFRKETFYAQAI